MAELEVQISKICAALQSEEKSKRKAGLQEILKICDSDELLDENELEFLWQTFHRPVVRLLNDQAEACRDLSAEVLKRFILKLPCSDKNIVYIIPILSKRLGSQELIETSEEVRLKCVIFLIAIISKYQEKLAAYFEDFVSILTRTVTDNYPNIKKESCNCICALAKILPSHFHSKSDKFVKPISANLTHQHHKVRVITINTLCEVLLYGNNKIVEDVTSSLAQRLFDQSSAVRIAVIEVAGKWMLELRDRYSWWHKLLPLLLTGIYDEIPEIRNKAELLWNKIGDQYLQENETDQKLKDKMDFLIEDPEHYPPDVKRPNLGCRVLVQQNFSKLIGGLGRELGDWLEDIRLRSAQLLCVLIINIEQHLTQHIQKLLPPMYRACNDENKRVVEIVELAAEYVGYFVPPNVYCDLVIPTLEENPTSGHLKVFAAILRGSPKNLLSEELRKIGNFLNQKHIYESRKKRYQIEILNCCKSLITVCEKDCLSIAEDLFIIIFTILGIAVEITIQQSAQALLILLFRIHDFEDLDQLYKKYINVILLEISKDCGSWTAYHPQYMIFCTIVTKAKSASYQNLDSVNLIFEETTKNDGDAEIRLKQFILLSEYLQQWSTPIDEESANTFVEFANRILEKVIIPGLIWSAGRTAEAIRTASVCCLCALLLKIVSNCDNFSQQHNASESIKDGIVKKLTKHPISVKNFAWLFEKINPILITLLDDSSYKTRLYSLKAICLVMNIAQETGYITEDHIHKTSSEVVSRLEDSHDDVRIAAVDALREIWKIIPNDYDHSFYRVHVEYVYSHALLHLDDPKLVFQQQVLDCLKDLVKVNPGMMIETIQNCRVKYINQKALDQLVELAESCLKVDEKNN